MKILNIGIDNTMLDENSKGAERMREYGELVDYYYLVVPDKCDREVLLSSKVKVVGVGGKCKLRQLWRMMRMMCRILRSDKIDVISAQDPFELSLVSWILARKFKIGLHIQEHGDCLNDIYWRNESMRNFFRYYLGRFLIKKADGVRVVSQRTKKGLVEKLDILADKIVSVPLFTDFVQSNEKKEKNINDKFVYLWIGRFEKQKNLPMMLRCFKRVLEQNKNTLLRLVGSGTERENIEKMIQDLNIGDNVEMIDWVEDVNSEYQKADVYLLPSFYEGWGRVVIEAIQNNLPVVMTRVGCADEVVRDGENGIVVSICDEDAFVDAMIRMQDKSLRDKFINNFQETLNRLPNREENLKLYKKSWEIAKESIKSKVIKS